jgi:hypothetical protein
MRTVRRDRSSAALDDRRGADATADEQQAGREILREGDTPVVVCADRDVPD